MKKFASCSLARWRPCHAIFLLQLISSLLSAQTADTSSTLSANPLPPVLIRDFNYSRNGYSLWKADSLPAHTAIALSDRLLWENTLDVRTNAPGTLATLSLRGAGPNRSPVFWNGINLQSPMNGVVDASLIPLWPGDKIQIQYGGQSAAQSNGAMAGSILLDQGPPPFRQGVFGSFLGAIGSFDRYDGNAQLGFSNAKISTSFRAAWQQAENDFTFPQKGLDGRTYVARQPNNFLEKTDGQGFVQVKIDRKNTIKAAFWGQKAFREIPPATTESAAETWQRDRSKRLVTTWENAARKNVLWSTRMAWLDDFIAFRLAGDTDSSHSRQLLLATERVVSQPGFSWRLGGNSTSQWAQADGYSDSTRWYTQQRIAAYGMCDWILERLRLSAVLRQEWAQNQAAPFTWSIGAQYAFPSAGTLRFNLARNFNLPTFNDRFWLNWGKPELRPEKGYSADLGWKVQWYGVVVQASVFQLIMDDWILWQPGPDGIFRPDNLRKVWSRGVETSLQWKTSIGAWKWETSARGQFSKTTNVAVYGGSANVLDMQLPFTPRTSGSLGLRIAKGVFSAAYLHQFTGSRLDNAAKRMKPFQYANFLASCTFLKQRLMLEFRLENIWNTRYEILRNHPMPGVSWRLGAGLRFG